MPRPNPDESEADFIERCMGDDEAVEDFPDTDQRAAFCHSEFERGPEERADMSDIEHKGINELSGPVDDNGTFQAVIATLGVPDSDNDVLVKGAFKDTGKVSILPAHDAGSVPLGQATIKERDDKVIASGRFNMEIAAAREWHSALKFDLANPPATQEWSWGFFPKEFRFGEHDGQKVRFLEKVDTMEVSPVLRGAGVGTGTLTAKQSSGIKLRDHVINQKAEFLKLLERLKDVAQARLKHDQKLSDETIEELIDLGTDADNVCQIIKEITDVASLIDDKKSKTQALYQGIISRYKFRG